MKGLQLVAPCPFCIQKHKDEPGRIAVVLNPESYFRGQFRCTQGCTPSGFHIHFGRLMRINGAHIPGFDPDADAYALSRGLSPPASWCRD